MALNARALLVTGVCLIGSGRQLCAGRGRGSRKLVTLLSYYYLASAPVPGARSPGQGAHGREINGQAGRCGNATFLSTTLNVDNTRALTFPNTESVIYQFIRQRSNLPPYTE